MEQPTAHLTADDRKRVRAEQFALRWAVPIGALFVLAGFGVLVFVYFSGEPARHGLRQLAPGLMIAGASLMLFRVRANLDRLGRLRIWHDVFLAFVPWIVGGALTFVLDPKTFVQIGFFVWYFPMFYLGVLLWQGRRTGTERFCEMCEYPFVEESPPRRCPECGSFWGRPHGLVVGHRKRSRRAIAAGVGCLVLALSASPLLMKFGGQVRTVLPVPVLSWMAHYGDWRAEAAWSELATRTLTPAEERGLAEIMLDRRLSSEPFRTLSGEKWLDGMYTSGRLPADLMQRYLEEQLRPYLSAPDLARVGQDATVTLLGRRAQQVVGALDARIALRGVRVGDAVEVVPWKQDAPGFLASDGKWIDDQLVAMRKRFPSTAGSIPSPPSIEFQPRSPGPLHVSATVWVVLFPSPSFVALTDWNSDGRPVIPAGAVWSKRYDLETTIEVLP